jgi:Flp pilus assembly protein TadD
VAADTANFNGIVRATAINELQGFPGETALAALRSGREDPDPLVRMAVADAAGWLEPVLRIRLLEPLLEDPLRLVRISAGRALASIKEQQLPEKARVSFAAALQEFEREQDINAERSSSMMKLGALRVEQGELVEAERLYRRGIELESRFGATYVNLADLYRAQGREREAEETLKHAIELIPGDASLYYALGLSEVRQRRYEDATRSLAEAARLMPEETGFAYAHAAALEALGRFDQAHAQLARAHERNPVNGMILRALMENAQRRGDAESLAEYGAQWRTLVGSSGMGSPGAR